MILQKLPGRLESASFLPQRKIKIEAAAIGGPSSQRNGFAVIAGGAVLARVSKDGPLTSWFETALKKRLLTMRNAHSNPPPRPFPIGIAQAALEDLAGILARQVLEDFDVFRHLVVGERGLELGADRADIQRHPGLRLHHRHQ